MLSTGPVARCSWGLSSHPPSEDFFNVKHSELAELLPLFWVGAPSSLLEAPDALWLPPTATMALIPIPCPHVPSLFDQQETAGLARLSLARLSFLNNVPLYDASGAH